LGSPNFLHILNKIPYDLIQHLFIYIKNRKYRKILKTHDLKIINGTEKSTDIFLTYSEIVWESLSTQYRRSRGGVSEHLPTLHIGQSGSDHNITRRT
jgi:hypothetical protein